MANANQDSVRQIYGDVVYIFAATPERAEAFARRKRLRSYLVLRTIEDLPREKGLDIVLVDRDYHLHPEYELFFTSGFMVDFRANILYGHEVKRD